MNGIARGNDKYPRGKRAESIGMRSVAPVSCHAANQRATARRMGFAQAAEIS